MKIIDKTPLLNEKGELGFTQRIQGVMEYGFNWPNELEAQKAIISYFDRQLEKGYTLIRNYTLGKSGITVPIILLGPSGLYVIHVAYLKGRYEARGESWNVASGDGYKPAPENLVAKTLRMARAVRAFIERQGVHVPVDIEPVLIGGDPGLHIESAKPAIRVLMIDGVKSFVASLATGQPVLRAETVYELTERIMNPHPPKSNPPASTPLPPSDSSPVPAQEPDPVVSRAQSIFKASEDVQPFDPADFDFAMGDEPSIEVTPPAATPSSPVVKEAAQPAKKKPQRYMGMTVLQWVILGALALALVCIAVGFAYYLLAMA